MASSSYSDITLPHPVVASPTYENDLIALGDALDKILEDMLINLSATTGLRLENLQNDIDSLVVNPLGRCMEKSCRTGDLVHRGMLERHK